MIYDKRGIFCSIETLNGENHEIGIKHSTFPAGEPYIKLEPQDALNDGKCVKIQANISTPEEIIQLCLIKNALDIQYPRRKSKLLIPYIPFGRQDRVTKGGESLSLKVFANILNDLKFDEIVTYSPHSVATEILVDNLYVKEPTHVFINRYYKKEDTIIIAPDAGAEKRATISAKSAYIDDVFVCSKKRNLYTGFVEHIYVPELPEDKHLIVIDDIIDGGSTFIQLAKYLPKKRKSLQLFATHGIFSKGRDVILEAGYDRIEPVFTFLEKK